MHIAYMKKILLRILNSLTGHIQYTHRVMGEDEPQNLDSIYPKFNHAWVGEFTCEELNDYIQELSQGSKSSKLRQPFYNFVEFDMGKQNHTKITWNTRRDCLCRF